MSVQQLALIYDAMGRTEDALAQYRVLLKFLRSLEDESGFDAVVKVSRNTLCLFFRSLPTAQRRVVNQLKRHSVTHDAMRAALQKIAEGDAVADAAAALARYERSGDTAEFEALACAFHVAVDDPGWITGA